MAKLAMVATIEVAPGCLDRLMPLMMAHRARSLADEPGTLQFELLLPNDDKNKVLIYEVYADDEAFQTHWNGPSMKRIQTESSGMVLNFTATRCSLAE